MLEKITFYAAGAAVMLGLLFAPILAGMALEAMGLG